VGLGLRVPNKPPEFSPFGFFFSPFTSCQPCFFAALGFHRPTLLALSRNPRASWCGLSIVQFWIHVFFFFFCFFFCVSNCPPCPTEGGGLVEHRYGRLRFRECVSRSLSLVPRVRRRMQNLEHSLCQFNKTQGGAPLDPPIPIHTCSFSSFYNRCCLFSFSFGDFSFLQ